MDWITTIVVIVVICVGLAIFYKALHEPLNMLFSWIWRGIMAIKGAGSRAKENTEEVIEYG